MSTAPNNTAASSDADQNESVDWAALFFDPGAAWPERLMARARRRFGDTPDAESAYNHAFECISANDWQRLSDTYTGKGSAAGFLAISFFNFMEDYARRKYPRVRPPAWLTRLGELWVSTWQLLCLKREPAESVVDALGRNLPERRDEIRQATVEIRRRVPNCGQYIAEVTSDDDLGAARNPERSGERPDEEAEREIAATLLQVAGGLLATGDAGQVPRTAPAALDALLAKPDGLMLDDTERLLMRLIYEDEHKIAAAARALGMTRKQASRLHGKVLQRLRTALGPLGLGGD